MGAPPRGPRWASFLGSLVQGKSAAIWTRPFVLATAATTSVFLGFYLMIPALPPYAASLGASKTAVGFVISIYSLSAIPARLLTGSLMDRRGRKPFLLAGLGIFSLCAALYPAASSYAALIGLRILHGAGWGWITTAMSALVADLAPPARRGEAIGYWGLAPTVGMAAGPAAGALMLGGGGGFASVFATTAGFGGLAALLVAPIGEPAPRAAGARALPSRIPRGAILPAAVLYLSSLAYGSLVAFLPVELARPVGGSGLFFMLYAATILISRPAAGRVSDLRGRAAVIHPGLALGAAGIALLALAPNAAAIGGAAILYGAGIGGAAFPGLLALAVDRSPVEGRSAALAAFFTAYDLAIASGSALFGPLYERGGFAVLNLVAAGAMVVSQVLLSAILRADAAR